jgi:hypothetical protein
MTSITGIILAPDGTPAKGLFVKGRLIAPLISGSTVYNMQTVAVTTGSDGSYSISLPSSSKCILELPYLAEANESARYSSYIVEVPASGPVAFSSSIVLES